MVGLQTTPLRNFAHYRSWPKRLGGNPSLQIIRQLSIAPPPAATCEKLQWSVHGETPALISTVRNLLALDPQKGGTRTPLTGVIRGKPVRTIKLLQRSGALVTILYYSTDRLSRSGTPVKN